MQNRHALSAVALAVAGFGCSSSSTIGSGGPVGTAQARIVLQAAGSGAATVYVKATNEITGRVVFERSFEAPSDAPTWLDVQLAPARYAFEASVYADASESVLLGRHEARAVLDADETTEVTIGADMDHGGDASVDVDVNTVPSIEGVASLLNADGTVTVRVSATDAEDEILRYFWSGPGIDGVVEGAPSISVDAQSVLNATGDDHVRIHVLVVDSDAASRASAILVDFDGTATVEPAELTACFSPKASCMAACGIDVETGGGATIDCTNDCILALAVCESD